MLLSSVQPSIISLFSSTGSNPLELFHANVDESLPADSFVQLLQDDLNGPIPDAKSLLKLPAISEDEKQDGASSLGYQACQTVLHIQSPTVRTTFVHAPSLAGQDLGIKHPWVHLQVRNLGRPWSFEIGIVDSSGRRGIIRASTFQVNYLDVSYFVLNRPRLVQQASIAIA